jgi:glycosyltransferase involved in cell wall biosynthesis
MRAGEPTTLRGRYAARVERHGVEAALATHRNAAHLDDRFNLGAYLMRNADVADAVSSPAEAVFHYLEYGIDEGRFALPETWQPSFVSQFHGVDLPWDHSALQANRALKAAGFGPDEALLCEEHLWMVLGVHGALFAHLFEPEYYIVAAEQAGHSLPARDRLSAIRHFCTVGLLEGIAPHPEHGFDADFYCDVFGLCGGGMPLPAGDRAALRAHWARYGVRHGAHANPRAWFRMTTGAFLPDAVLQAMPAIRIAATGLHADATLAQTLSHLAATPLPAVRALDPAEPEIEGFLLDLARHRRASGDAAAAEGLLQRVLDHHPGHPLAALELADLIHAQHRVATEIELRRAVPADFDMGANGITLAERLVSQGQYREALDVCAGLPATLFADVALRRRRRGIARAIFGALWSDLGGQLHARSVAELQSLLADALTLYTPPFTAPPRTGAIRRVALLVNDDLYQCKLYRADQKLEQLRAAGYQADLFLQAIDLERLRDRLDLYDAVIFVRIAAFPEIIDLIAEAAQQGLATFYDCDDLIFDAEVFPPPLETYAGGLTAADHAAIACGVPLFRHAMSLCENAIASTPTIRDAMAGVVRSSRAFVHRNALGLHHERAMGRVTRRTRGPGDKLVVHYASGTKAHKAEFAEMLEPALAAVLAQRPGQVEIRIIGDMPGLTHLDPEHPDVHVQAPSWDFETYCAKVAEADIALSVLAPGVLTDAKSEIKWMEAAMFAIPSVVSPTATFLDVVEDGVTGMIAADTAGFVDAILRLVDDAPLRQRIGEAAREQALRTYGLPTMAANWTEIFDAVRPSAAAAKARLLIVNVFYPPQDIGGATRVVQDNVADLLARYGDSYEIDIIATLEGGTRPHHVECHARDGVRIWTITARDAIETMEVSDHRMGDVFDRLLERIAPDLVHLHCIQRLTASIVDRLRARGLPYVVTLHDGWWISPNHFIVARDGTPETYDFRPEAALPLPERGRVTGRALEGASAVLAVSDAFAGLHRKLGLDAVEVAENGVSALPERVVQPGPEGRVRLGLIGGMSRHKGYALLRAALHARRFENLDLVVVDHAMQRGRTRQEMWNGTPVLFLPRSPLHEVGTIYGRIDVLLAPSVWPESYGLVTREALALGLWVVASDRGAVGQDVTEGENGFVVDVSDHHGLVEALTRIDADPERYRTPPAKRPRLRRSGDQADTLHAVYQRILGAPDP